MLFSGSLRDNLDPFGRYSDSEIWSALRKTSLEMTVAAMEHALDYDLGENGDTLRWG